MAAPIALGKYPRAIIHIDGDAFFASCEQARNPDLRGKVVVTGRERGIAASMSYEAKALGITRAMRLYEIKRRFPQAIILPSDYEMYSLLSKRFFDIVRRYTSEVEEYGIDECFADLTGFQRPLRMSYQKICERIQADLTRELGFTFSIGLAGSKVLAKVGSKWKKPHGLTAIPNREIHAFLEHLEIGDVWGIGRQTAALLQKYGIHTALDFARRDEAWVKRNFYKPQQEIWAELRGQSVMPLATEPRSEHYSVQKMRTFTPPSNDPKFVFSQLAKNIESACIKARGYGMEASRVYVLLRTQDFRHQGMEIKLSRPTNFAHELINLVKPAFDELFRPGTHYRATMINLSGLEIESAQHDLFGGMVEVEGYRRLYAGIDELRKKYGKHTVHFGTSFYAQHFDQHLGDRGDVPERHLDLLKGETLRRRINIPMLNCALSD